MSSTTQAPGLIPLWPGFEYYEHQKVAVNWLLNLERSGYTVDNTKICGGILADDMGLGKTMEIAGLLKNNPQARTLLFAPLALIQTWTDVCTKANFNVYHFDQTKKLWKLVARARSLLGPAVYITNYEKVLRNASICKAPWDRIVLDEAHKIRSRGGMLNFYMRSVAAPYRWAITGTPVVNTLNDISAILRFCGYPTKTGKWVQEMWAALPHLMLRRSMEELRDEISGAPPVPEIERCIVPFQTAAEAEFYRGIQGALKSKMRALRYTKDTSAERLTMLLRLRQLSIHPQVYINAKRRELGKLYDRPDWTGPVSKFEEARGLMETDDQEQHRWLFICNFFDEMVYLKKFLLEEGLAAHVEVYNGQTPQVARDAILERARTAEIPAAGPQRSALLLQIHAGGCGLNLQEFDRVVFMSPWWSSALIDQAMCRAVRIGQKKVVKVYHLVLEEEYEASQNIDRLMHEKVEMKRQLAEDVFNAACHGVQPPDLTLSERLEMAQEVVQKQFDEAAE
jgi:SNF2 family DNA or RNA helicase